MGNQTFIFLYPHLLFRFQGITQAVKSDHQVWRNHYPSSHFSSPLLSVHRTPTPTSTLAQASHHAVLSIAQTTLLIARGSALQNLRMAGLKASALFPTSSTSRTPPSPTPS